jgi:cobalamin biosynthesis protein CobT
MSSGVYGLKTGDVLTNCKFALAHAAARSLARLLQSVNVPFAVGGFTTADTESYTYGASRSLDLVNFLFKDFHEPWAASEQNMLAMNTFSTYKYQGKEITSHCNSDGESILWAAGHLLLREEDTKVLIVLSDGLPAGGNSTLQAGFLKWVVKRVMISGVKIGALGLGCEDVKYYYPVHETLSQFPEGSGTAETAPLYLQEKVIGLVNKLMMSEEKV